MPPRKGVRSAEASGDPGSPGHGRAGDGAAPIEYTYQQRYTRCNKASCRRCTEGPGHGPYWYAFWWEGGRTRVRYLGKEPPAAVSGMVAAGPELRVATLGRFAVWRAGVPLPESAWPRRKAVALFKLLLSVPGRRLLRDEAIDLLWPDDDPEAAHSTLRAAAHGLRLTLDPPAGESVLAVHDGVFALAGDGRLQVDADAFAAAAEAALAGRDIEACRSAIALYAGEYLPDDRYEDWATRRREELAALHSSLLMHRARLCAEEGDLAEAGAALAAVLEADPAREEAAIQQMTLLAAMGERTEALRVYARLRDALREQYALAPGEEIAGLALRLQAQQAARAPQRPPAQSQRHTNLPGAQSSFVGRQDDQEAVRRLLGESRLVTLKGPGGAGKTRLAMRVAESLLDLYPDGAWLCELAGVARAGERPREASAPDPVAIALAGALRLVEDPAYPLEETICAFLEPRRLLLVLDNCEHVLDAAAGLAAAILARCPDVTVLATSQEALGLPAEAVWPVSPLALPDAGRRDPPERLGTYDAIRLFVERARAARPGFVLSEATAPLVLEICRRLDGIPLALELAAARLAFLSLEALASRLDDRFHLLVGGSRVALPRHQTLRAAMDWSHSLLGLRERTLLRRLTVFAGGWALAAAEGICADAELPPEMVLDALGGLVAKSLVTVQEEGDALRYGMLETVRQYGRARLAEAREEAAIHERHLLWFARHCEDAIATWSSTDQAALLRGLDAELENIRTALAWGLEPDHDPVAALRLTSALSRYWTTRGLVSEGRRWTARALDAAPDAPADLRATALNRCAILARMEGDSVGAGAFWEASLALSRELGDTQGVARVVGNLGLLYYDLGDDDRALTAMIESLALKRQRENKPAIAEVLLNLGLVYRRQRRYAAAEEAFAEASAIWEASGDQADMGNAYLHMADIARDQQQLDRAAHLYTGSLRTSLSLGDRPQLARAMEGMAHVLLHRYESGPCARTLIELSTQLFACVAALRESIGVRVDAGNLRTAQASLQRLQTLLGPEAFESAWCSGWEAPVLALIERIPE